MRDTLTVLELEAVINRLRRNRAADDYALSAELQGGAVVYARMILAHRGSVALAALPWQLRR